MSSTQLWLTVREVASELQVHEETVRRWIRAGDLLAIELGGPRTLYRIRPADLDAFLRRRGGAEQGHAEHLLPTIEERLLSHIASLKQLAATLIVNLSMDDMVGELFGALPDGVALTLAHMHLVSAGRRSLTSYTRRWDAAGTASKQGEIEHRRVPLDGDTLVQRVIETGESQRIPDLRRTAYLEADEDLREHDARSALAVAVKEHTRTVAVIEVFNSAPSMYQPIDRTYLEATASIVALALARQEARWLTVPDVASTLDVRSETVRRWIRSGELVASLPGGVRAGYRIDAAQLDAFLRRRQLDRDETLQ